MENFHEWIAIFNELNNWGHQTLKYLFFARIYDKMWSSVLYLDRKSNDSRNEFIIIASKTS